MKLIDDERDKHPFYSDWGIAQHKKKLKELEDAAKEKKKTKDNARAEAGEIGIQPVEKECVGEGSQPVRVVRKRSARTKRTSHHKQTLQETNST